MKFVSTRIITADVKRLVGFYEMVTRVPAVWGNDLFAEIPTPVGTLAIGSDKTVLNRPGFAAHLFTGVQPRIGLCLQRSRWPRIRPVGCGPGGA